MTVECTREPHDCIHRKKEQGAFAFAPNVVDELSGVLRIMPRRADVNGIVVDPVHVRVASRQRAHVPAERGHRTVTDIEVREEVTGVFYCQVSTTQALHRRVFQLNMAADVT